jgi:hypothetical protein
MPKQIEAGLQEAVVRYLRLMLRDCVVYHTPNGGKRSIKTAKLMKRIGTFSGVFDLTILAPGGRTYFIELKKNAKEKLTDNQDLFKLALIRMGFTYAVAWNLDQVQLALETWGLTKRSVRNAVDNGDGLFGNSSGQDGTTTEGRKKRMGSSPLTQALQNASTTKAETVAESDTHRHTSPIRPTRPNT